MFSQVSVILLKRGVLMWPLTMMHWTPLYSPPGPSFWPCPPPVMEPHCARTPWPWAPLWTWHLTIQDLLLVTSGGHHWRPVQTYSFQGSGPSFVLQVLTSWFYWHMYGQHKPGGTHHTGKFSCFWSMFPLSSSTHTPENSNPSNFTKCHLELWLW